MPIKNLTLFASYALLKSNDDTIMVDVRTPEEWLEAAIPNSEEGKIIFVSWRVPPDMSINSSFTKDLQIQLEFNKMTKSSNILFLCRSGFRSTEAANSLDKLGYINCFNIVGGIESGNGNLSSNIVQYK